VASGIRRSGVTAEMLGHFVRTFTCGVGRTRGERGWSGFRLAGSSMNVQTASAVGASLVALAFCFSTFERWLARRRRHELAWSGSLLLFSLASASLAVGAAGGWNGPVFRLFYLFGAIVNVPFLALGTVYLLAGPRAGDRAGFGVCLFGAFAAGVVAIAPFRAPIPRGHLPQGSAVFGPLPRVLAGVASGGGALIVIGGAVWSIWRVRRGRMAVANGLIAVGTLITGASGLLNSVVNAMTAFSVTLLVGISVIFAGFLVASMGAAAVPAAADHQPGSPLSRSPDLREPSDGAASPQDRMAATGRR